MVFKARGMISGGSGFLTRTELEIDQSKHSHFLLKNKRPTRQGRTIREQDNVCLINLLDLTARETSLILNEPQQVLSRTVGEASQTISAVHTDHATAKNIRVNRIACANPGEKIAFSRASPLTIPVGRGEPSRSHCVIWSDQRCALRMELNLKRKDESQIETTRPHPIRESVARDLTQCHDLANMRSNISCLLVKKRRRKEERCLLAVGDTACCRDLSHG